MIEPIQKNSLFEHVSQQVIRLVKSGEWKEGEKIPGELELSRLFGISRNSIREAMKTLQSARILEAKSGSGTFVAPNALQIIQQNEFSSMLSQQEYFDEILETRIILETQCAYFAAKYCTQEDIAALEESIREIQERVKAGDKYGVMEQGHLFHTILVDILDNRIISNFYRSISNLIMEERRAYVDVQTDAGCDIDGHFLLVEALKARDADGARKIMEDHLGNMKKRHSHKQMMEDSRQKEEPA